MNKFMISSMEHCFVLILIFPDTLFLSCLVQIDVIKFPSLPNFWGNLVDGGFRKFSALFFCL